MTDPSPPTDSEKPMYSNTIKIPKDRIGVIIGTDGEVKTLLEEEFNAKVHVDSQEGDVTCSSVDSLKLYDLCEVIKAIGRGFNPDVAMRLTKQDFTFELINVSDFVKNKNHLPRIKGRVIGTKGKARKHMEELTDTSICVYGKTVGIIGQAEDVMLAKRAIESMLSGSPHSAVYKWLEKQRREMHAP